MNHEIRCSEINLRLADIRVYRDQLDKEVKQILDELRIIRRQIRVMGFKKSGWRKIENTCTQLWLEDTNRVKRIQEIDRIYLELLSEERQLSRQCTQMIKTKMEYDTDSETDSYDNAESGEDTISVEDDPDIPDWEDD